MKLATLNIGLLRSLLILISLVLSTIGLWATPSTEIEGWPVLTSIVAPSLAVMIGFALALDLVMNSIFRLDSPNLEKERLANVIKIEVL